jgi:hypothetical protein
MNVITTSPAMAPGQAPTPVGPAPRLRDRILGHDRRPASLRSRRDIENAGYDQPPEPPGVAAGSEPVQMETMGHKRKRMNYMDLVQSVWHWHSVEWGGKCEQLLHSYLHLLLTNSRHLRWL